MVKIIESIVNNKKYPDVTDKSKKEIINFEENLNIIKNKHYTKKKKEKFSEFSYYYSSEFLQGNEDYNEEIGTDPKEYIFSRITFLESKEKLENMIELFVKTDDVEEGMYTCYNCGSKRAISDTKQVRRADENSTTTVVCYDCGTKWTD